MCDPVSEYSPVVPRAKVWQLIGALAWFRVTGDAGPTTSTIRRWRIELIKNFWFLCKWNWKMEIEGPGDKEGINHTLPRTLRTSREGSDESGIPTHHRLRV